MARVAGILSLERVGAGVGKRGAPRPQMTMRSRSVLAPFPKGCAAPRPSGLYQAREQ